MTTFPEMLLSVSAEGSKVYENPGYTVSYDITGSWADYQNVSVTITNTGTETVENWALKSDFNGNIKIFGMLKS